MLVCINIWGFYKLKCNGSWMDMVDPVAETLDLHKNLKKKYQKPCVQALGHLCVWFACQEDREQSSSGSEKYVHCPFCVKWQAKADSPQVLGNLLTYYQVMETIKQEACGLVFSDINLSLPVVRWTISNSKEGGDGRKPVGLQTPAINFPIGISKETRNNEAITI
jgi:hypothetical protein